MTKPTRARRKPSQMDIPFRQRLSERWQGDVEQLDTTPVEIPVGALRPPSIEEQMQRFIRVELSNAKTEDGYETFDESNDFEPDDPDTIPMTEYELRPMQEDPEPPLDGSGSSTLPSPLPTEESPTEGTAGTSEDESNPRRESRSAEPSQTEAPQE